MENMNEKLTAILSRVRKPARYAGGEYAAVVKDKAGVNIRVAFCFPDSYEIGMSHLGLKLLYGLYNAQEDVWCERCFAPWPDMEEEMRREGVPLYALESRDPLSEFDIIAFTLQYEMCYSNVLNMLDLAGLPVYAKDREGLDHMVWAGGPCAANPEPMAEFIDLFMVGEGEEVTVELLDLYRTAKAEKWDKRSFLRKAADIPGVYVPMFYEPEYAEDGTMTAMKTIDGVPEKITKRIVKDLDKAYFPEYFVVPSTEVVHDRVMVEIMRGCIRGCRFCQAGYSCRPVRSRSKETLVNQVKTLCEQTGYEEVSLTSLSSSDYREVNELCSELSEYCKSRRISLAMPSQRADSFSIELMEQLQEVRKTGLTFAPEAGTQRLRDVINKNILEEDIMNACSIAFAGGASSVKLYFMMGLPTETDEDLLGIADLSRKVLWSWRTHAQNRQRGVKITASVAYFVPKPHTPFQWAAQETVEEFQRRTDLLKDPMKIKNVTFNWHDAQTSFMEAVFARGDRRVGSVIYDAWKNGAKFDAWDEHFKPERWHESFERCGLSMAFYANRERTKDECLPWDHISYGVSREHLWKEYERALAGETTPDCRSKCTGCGALSLLMGGKCDA